MRHEDRTIGDGGIFTLKVCFLHSSPWKTRYGEPLQCRSNVEPVSTPLAQH